MCDNSEKYLTNRDVQLFFDGANALLNAARIDEEKLQKSTEILITHTNKLNAHFMDLKNDVTEGISQSAEITAKNAAGLLTAKFQKADKAAHEAAKMYNDAVKRLNYRYWLYFTIAQVAFVVLFLALVFILVPSMDEIQHRRAELAYLDKQLATGKSRLSTSGEK